MLPAGIQFVIIDSVELDVEARLNGIRIGYADCIRDNDRLQLADIRILEDLTFIRPTILERVRSFLKRPKLKTRRGQGIGTELLRTVLRAADAAGVQEVWGSVTHADLAQQPALLAWYERHGFTVAEPDSECVETAARKIVRRR